MSSDGNDRHGLVLLNGSVDAVASWARRGLVATRLVAFPGMVGVALAEDRARSVEPYDVGLQMLAARPVPGRMRPAIGLFAMDGCAVITVQAKGFGSPQRWLVWDPGEGLRRTPELPLLGPDLLIASAGAQGRVNERAIVAMLRQPAGRPIELLVALMRLLGLPGEDVLIAGEDPGELIVEPSERSVRAFDRLVAEEAAQRAGIPGTRSRAR